MNISEKYEAHFIGFKCCEVYAENCTDKETLGKVLNTLRTSKYSVRKMENQKNERQETDES